jgi:hypothetical protein
MDIGGMAGYVYLHPNAIRAQLYAPNEYANVARMRFIMDDILARMASMPGMSPNLLFKYPPWQGMREPGWSEIAGNALSMPPILGNGARNLGYPLGAPREPWNPGRKDAWQSSPPGFLDGLFGGDEDPSLIDSAYSKPHAQARRHELGMGMRIPRGIQNMDSLLFSLEELTSPSLAEALRRTMPFDLPDGQIRFHLVAGPRIWGNWRDTSVNPAWRRTYAHVSATGGTPNAQPLRDMSPNSGAYSNEVS